jgi:hypothetical protein
MAKTKGAAPAWWLAPAIVIPGRRAAANPESIAPVLQN